MIQGEKDFRRRRAHRMRLRPELAGVRAGAQGCIVLKSIAEVEQEVVNDKGEKSHEARAGRQGRAGRRSHLDRDG